MTIGVVDLFEPVEVEERDRQRQPAALRAGQISLEQLGEQAAVRQTSERIAQGEGSHVLLQTAQLGHVAADTLQTTTHVRGLRLADHDRSVGVTEVEVEPLEHLTTAQGAGNR